MFRLLAAFARFSDLRQLDLDLLRAGEISRGHAKAASSDLLDRAVWPITIFAPMKTLWVFASFTRVGFSANLIHRDGEALVCFRTQCAKRHSSGGKSAPDFFDRLHLLQRGRLFARGNAFQQIS